MTSVSQTSHITKPKPKPTILVDATEYNDGQVVVKTGTGLIKIRKGQSEETYLEQRNQFWETGPLLNTNTWLDDYLLETILSGNLHNLKIASEQNEGNEIQDEQKIDGFQFDKVDKVQRERIFRGLEKLYFERNYSKCLECCNELLKTMKIPNDELLQTKKFKLLRKLVSDIKIIQERCQKKLDN